MSCHGSGRVRPQRAVLLEIARTATVIVLTSAGGSAYTSS